MLSWGSEKMTTEFDHEQNARFEQECLEQAKRELHCTDHPSLSLIHKVLMRAQQIKLERQGKSISA